jgi:hypothetical protein
MGRTDAHQPAGEGAGAPASWNGLQREQAGAEVLDLAGREVRGCAVLVVAVAGGQDVADGGGGAVVEIRGRAPEFDQRWNVEFVGRVVEGATGADVVMAEVGGDNGYRPEERADYGS